jgi:TorA maturation chaperone TorD
MSSTLATTAGAVAPDADALVHRADLMLCLAQAFLPPPAEWSVCDWGQPLVEDLSELGQELTLDVSSVSTAVAEAYCRWVEDARAQTGSADAWLVEYARLFLVPPVPVALNTSAYLEGALAGSSTQMIASCYGVAGFEPSGRLHDLPDHVAMQLEFLGKLYERAARGDADALGMAEEFVDEFLSAWIGPLCQACQVAAGRFPAARVYHQLALLLKLAIDR